MTICSGDVKFSHNYTVCTIQNTFERKKKIKTLKKFGCFTISTKIMYEVIMRVMASSVEGGKSTSGLSPKCDTKSQFYKNCGVLTSNYLQKDLSLHF